jgi:hypothetical protein
MCTKKAMTLLLVLVIALLIFAPRMHAQETNFDWPRQIDSSIGQIIMYEPQPDSLDGDTLSGRAAISLQRPSEKEPVFGALWFRSQVAVDRDEGTVTFINIKVLRVRFPDAEADETQKFTDAVESEVPQWELVMSVKQLEEGLAASQQEVSSTENLKSDPPQIIFSQTPAVLVSFDGDPELRAIENTPYQRIVNTAFLIIKDKSGTYYLSNGQTWYSSTNPTGDWKSVKNPPEEIKKLVPPDKDAAPAEPSTAPVPKIIAATVPTELVVTDGAPKWTALTGNELLYASNTETTWIKEIATNKYYLLLSGRWFSSQSLDGPWAYERGDQLPSSFKKIAPASPIGDALAAVPGTNEAEDAVMDSEIPQTAAVKRSEAKTEVSYDGDPQFQDIPSTDIQYAANTDSSVLKIGSQYYVCDNAVWFVGPGPKGPWVVADSVPDSVKTIPPSSPVYNVRYVQVYSATPTIVYVGYTPGYIGTYRYYGTVVYGTGYVYRPWIGPVYYYPRPFTWGFHVIYNPYSGGWGYALGYSTSFINVSISWGNSYYRRPSYWNGGWWGPGGYRPIYRPLPGYRPPYYRPPHNVRPIYPGRPTPYPGRPSIQPYPRDNIYAKPVNKGRVTRDVPNGGRIAKPVKKPDNIYTDKNGDVYRRDNKGNWQKHEDKKWKPTTPPNTQPGSKPGATRPSTRPARPGAETPTTQPVKPNPSQPTKPSHGKPSTQPVNPEQPGTTKPAPRPTKPQPGAPTTQPVKPEQPGTTKPAPRPTKPQPGAPTTQPVKPEQPGTTKPAPRPTKPQPGAPSTQPVKPEQPGTTKPAPRPTKPQPGAPSAQPVKPEQPETTKPAPRPTKPRPDAPTTQPVKPDQPGTTKPSPTRPHPKPASPSAKPSQPVTTQPSQGTAKPRPAPPKQPTKPSQPSAQPATNVPSGLNRDAAARSRGSSTSPSRSAAPQQQTQTSGKTSKKQPT